MSEERAQRKVTVILAADVVGYSTMMETNEEQTLKNLKACREIIDSLISEYHGRIFNTAGDSVIAEFQSAVDAVVCSSEFQKTLKKRNESNVESQKMEFRVGINMGDVVIEGDNLYGEGVNVAARLEALAQPGGVCLSKNVHEIVNNKTNFDFHDLGEQKVKNTKIHAVDVTLDGTDKRKLSQAQQVKNITPWKKYLAISLITGLIVGVGVWWWHFKTDFKPADKNKFAYELPEKPSIVVLPFINVSGDSTKEYISNGLTQNIISVLAKSPDLFVIGQNSISKYKNKERKINQIAEELGVRYVLEGNVQLSGENMRVTTQLFDTIKGRILWSDRFDKGLNDIFIVQDEITEEIFLQLQVNIVMGVRAFDVLERMNSDPEDFRYAMIWRENFMKFTKEGREEAIRLTKIREKNDPDNSLIALHKAWLQLQKIIMKLSKDPKTDIKIGREFAEKAYSEIGGGISVIPQAWFYLFERNYDKAVEKARLAIELGPSNADILANAGNMFMFSGDYNEALNLYQKAMRLSPYHPKWYANRLAECMLAVGKNQKAGEILEAIIRSEKKDIEQISRALTSLIVKEYRVGNLKQSENYLNQLNNINPKFSLSSVKSYSGLHKNKIYLDSYLKPLKELGLQDKY